MLTFLSPWFLVGAVAAVVPIVLHLLKREPEPLVRFAAVKLLKHAPVEYTERRRIRELLLLALRVAALVLFALAFARPFLASGAAVGSPGVTIVVLDTSFSMSAPGVFNRAKQLATSAIDHAPAGDLVGVVTFADVPNLVARAAPDRALARAAVDAATPGFGATRYRGALSAAVQAFGGRRGTIVVVTDLQENGWDAGGRASVPESARIEIADVGPPPPNLAVTAIHAGDRIVASVRNSGDRSRTTRARLTIDNNPAADVAVTVGPHASVDVEFPGATGGADASTLAVAIDDAAGIPVDNVRYAVRDRANRATILVITATGDLGREAFYVQQALLAATASGDSYQLTGIAPAQLSVWDATRLTPHDAVILLSTRGLERHGREALAAYASAGGGLLIAVGPDIDGDVVGDVLGVDAPLRIVSANARREDRSLAPADRRHPIFQSFSTGAATLGLVRFHTVPHVEGSGCQAVARFTTGETALLDCPTGRGRALVLASDLNNRWSDFPLHATFVPFLHEAVRYLASGRSQNRDYLVGDVPAGIPATPGIVAIPGPSPPSRQVAVNVDPRESDPARLSAADFEAVVTRLKQAGAAASTVEARQQEDSQQLWRYALGLMLAVLVLEGVVASRTA
jgi:Aerotolerance regulator N-terminal/von Willebrand factor type A domain